MLKNLDKETVLKGFSLHPELSDVGMISLIPPMKIVPEGMTDRFPRPGRAQVSKVAPTFPCPLWSVETLGFQVQRNSIINFHRSITRRNSDKSNIKGFASLLFFGHKNTC